VGGNSFIAEIKAGRSFAAPQRADGKEGVETDLSYFYGTKLV